MARAVMRWGIALAFVASIALIVSSTLATPDTPDAADGQAALPVAPVLDLDGFARAVEPREWAFPADHGAHPEYQTEWLLHRQPCYRGRPPLRLPVHDLPPRADAWGCGIGVRVACESGVYGALHRNGCVRRAVLPGAAV